MNKPILFAVLLFSFASCTKEVLRGSGAVVSETRSISGFTRLVARGSTDVYITQGPAFEVKLTGYENLLPYMETRLTGNTLEIGYRDAWALSNDNVDVYITLPVLEGVKVSGSADVTAKGNFTAANFDATVSGSGDFVMQSGSVSNFSGTVSGSGEIKAYGLVAQQADVRVSGSGRTEISVTDKLKVRISGSGTVYYKGRPVVEQEISGSGKLVPR